MNQTIFHRQTKGLLDKACRLVQVNISGSQEILMLDFVKWSSDRDCHSFLEVESIIHYFPEPLFAAAAAILDYKGGIFQFIKTTYS